MRIRAKIMRIRAKIKNFAKRHFNKIAVVSTLTTVSSALTRHGYCTTDTSSSITEWMPTIINFAMLAVVIGLLKKLGKW